MCTHLSAYNKTTRTEIALLQYEDSQDTLRLIICRPCGPRRHNGSIRTNNEMMHVDHYFEEFDPLVIRCVVLDEIEKLKEKMKGRL